MIVQRFLRWASTAPAGKRAEATSALARAYLYSDLGDSDRSAAETAMTLMLDDLSPIVREALAMALGSSPQAPRHIVLALSNDQPDVAAIVVEASPLLLEVELLALLGEADERVRRAAARRLSVSSALAGALVEKGGPETVCELLLNPGARLTLRTLDLIVERHGAEPGVRDILLERDDLPVVHRQALISRLGASLSALAATRAWLGDNRADRVAREACERETVGIALGARGAEMGSLAAHLRGAGQLTAGLLVRVAIAGGFGFVTAALAELAGLPSARAERLLADRQGSGFEALAARAGLPPAVGQVLRLAREFAVPQAGPVTVDAMLDAVAARRDPELDGALAFLRRLSAEMRREETRQLARDLGAAA